MDPLSPALVCNVVILWWQGAAAKVLASEKEDAAGIQHPLHDTTIAVTSTRLLTSLPPQATCPHPLPCPNAAYRRRISLAAVPCREKTTNRSLLPRCLPTAAGHTVPASTMLAARRVASLHRHTRLHGLLTPCHRSRYATLFLLRSDTCCVAFSPIRHVTSASHILGNTSNRMCL